MSSPMGRKSSYGNFHGESHAESWATRCILWLVTWEDDAFRRNSNASHETSHGMSLGKIRIVPWVA